jgi:hypothetical protein
VAVAQKAYSDYLEGYSDYSVQLFDGHPTRGEMFETVLYGSLAHANQPKREKLQTWTRDDIRANLLQQEFAAMLVRILRVIDYIKELSQKELNREPA